MPCLYRGSREPVTPEVYRWIRVGRPNADYSMTMMAIRPEKPFFIRACYVPAVTLAALEVRPKGATACVGGAQVPEGVD